MSHAAAAPQTAPSLEAMLSLVGDDMTRVDEVLIEKSHSNQAELVTQLARYIVRAGGKRVRPALTLAAAQLCGYTGDRHIKLAACVEFIHTATLLHDDVIDESTLRRGQKTAHEVWDNTSSVLVGDFLFSRAFQLMVEDGSLPVLKILCDASATISEGEVRQLMVTRDVSITEQTNLEVIEAKTSALFAAACEVGATVCDDAPDKAEALRLFGHYFGVAFQLTDDALDYCASQEALGKTIGDDLREGKVTLPVITAYQNGTAEEKAIIEQAFDEEAQSAPDLAQIINIIQHHDGLGYTLSRAQHYGEKAKEALADFAPTPIKNALLEAVDFCIQRAY